MNSNMMSQRNYGIDLLRMVAMYMIVVLHVLKQGGILAATKETSACYEIAWLLEIAAICAVNCYALISGYVGIKSKYKYSNIIVLWLRVVFYTLGITLVSNLIFPEKIGVADYVKAVFPISTEQYWYFNAYLALFIFIPILNRAVNMMKQEQLRASLIVLIIAYSIMQTIIHKDVMGTAYGYSGLWLIILYLIGAYIRKYDVAKRCATGKALLGYAGMILVTWGSKFAIELGTLYVFGEGKSIGGNFLVNYTSPTILGAGIFLLVAFEKIKVNVWMEKMISLLSPLAFSVYLIHVHPLVWDNFLESRYVEYASLDVLNMVATVVGTSLIIYLVCSIFDLGRNHLFRKLNVSKKIWEIEDKFVGQLWDD